MRVKTTHFLAVILSLTAAAAPLFAQSKKVRFSVSAASIAEVPFRIANVKGFYRDEGLDVEMILIRGAVGMQALLGGSVDYTSASGSTIAAAVRGLPVKLVFIASAKFEGVPLLERHRMVNDALREEMKQIHALSLKTWTPEQWQQRKDSIPQ